MKAVVLIAAVIFVAQVKSMTIAEQKQMLSGAVQECKISEGASDEDVGRMIAKKPQETKEGKCFFACVMETLGATTDGKIDRPGIVEYVSVAVGDPGKSKLIEELIDECSGVKHDDRCEMGVLLGTCLKMGGMKRKLDFGL